MYLQTSDASPTHARVLVQPATTMSVAWCAACGNVSIYRRPLWRRWLDRWLPLTGFLPASSCTLSELAARQAKQPNGFAVHRQLIYQISMSFAHRARAEGASDVETVAWRLAKQALPPIHQIEYIMSLHRYVPSTRLLTWLDDVEALQAVVVDPQLKSMVRGLRTSLLEG